jgi:hypothetical protein
MLCPPLVFHTVNPVALLGSGCTLLLAIDGNSFPYAFFFQGFTGRAIKMGAILPFVVMKEMAWLPKRENLSRIWVSSRGSRSR